MISCVDCKSFGEPVDWSWTESEIMGYAVTFGAESAYNVLLLLPPDRFKGDYFRVLDELKKRSDS